MATSEKAKEKSQSAKLGKAPARPNMAREIVLDSVIAALSVAAAVVPAAVTVENSRKAIVYAPSAAAMSLMESDYQVPGLSDQQIDEIAARGDVTAVLPYFSFGGSAEGEGEINFPANVDFLPDADHLKMTPYFPERFVSGYEELTDGKIYVDSVMAAQGHLAFGSSFSLLIGGKKLQLQVAGISDFDPLGYDGNGVAILCDEAKEDLLAAFFKEDEAFAWSGAYVACSDSASFYEYIKDYLPENERPTLEDYGGDEISYASAVEAFENGDYSGNIVELSRSVDLSVNRSHDLTNAATMSAISALAISGILLLLIMIVKLGAYAFLLRNVENGTKNYRPFWKLEHLMGPLTAALSGVGSLIAVAAVPGALSTLFALTPVVSLAVPLLGYGISLPLIKKMLLRRK